MSSSAMIPTKTRSESVSSLPAEFKAFQVAHDGVMTPLDFYNYSIEIGVLVPLDVIVKLFQEVDANNDGNIDLDEFLRFIMETNLELKRNPNQIVVNRLLHDKYFWPIAFYLPAGVFFMLGSFFSYTEDPGDFWMVSYIIAHLFYIVQPLITLLLFPIELWRNEIEDEKMAQKFKQIILQKANRHSLELQNEQTDSLTIARYIQEEYFANGIRYLTKADVEKILVTEMGAIAEEAVVDSIFSRLDVGGQHKIYPDEILLFSMKNHRSISALGRLWKTIKAVLGDIGYLLNTVFVLALTLGIVQYATMIHGQGLMDDFKNFKRKKTVYQRIRLCRLVLEKFVYAAPFLVEDSSTWKEFEREGLDWQGLRLLLEESGISLSDKLLSLVFTLIDRSNTATVSKLEVEDFVNSRIGEKSTILWLCIRSFSFWADFSWTIASICYICSSYSSESLQIEVFDNVGSVFFFLGAFPLMYGCWDDARSCLSNEHILIRELQRRCGSGKNLTTGSSHAPISDLSSITATDHKSVTVQADVSSSTATNQKFVKVEAGAVFSFPCTRSMQCVHVRLQTEGHPIDASVELTENDKQRSEINVVAADGRANHFNTAVNTQGLESIVTVSNRAKLAVNVTIHPLSSSFTEKTSPLEDVH
eukprot:scaffold1246_cov134-Cylindrotheca_fusiformis.AAC.7